MKDFWEQRYGADEYAYGVEPNAFLVDQAGQLAPQSKLLVVGDGEGRNGVWLAGQGMQVTSVDYSAEGVKKSQALAAQRGVNVNAICADLTAWAWPEGEFDAVAAIFVHFPSSIRAQLHAAMLKALKPGGLLILEGFHKDQLNYESGGPPNEDMLYTTDMLRGDVKDTDIILLEQGVTMLDEGRFHSGDGAVVRLVAERRGA